MSKLVAFLRGINVGRAKRIAMADLRQVIQGLGFTDVQTLLNSGNVVFTGPVRGAAAQIETALHEKLGVSSRVTVLTVRHLQQVLAGNPLPAATAEPSRFLVTFLEEAPTPETWKGLTSRDWSPEQVALGLGVVYLWCPGGIHESPLAKAVTRLHGIGGTARNWATLQKLAALVN